MPGSLATSCSVTGRKILACFTEAAGKWSIPCGLFATRRATLGLIAIALFLHGFAYLVLHGY
jgi:hypothetical protein